MGGGGNALSYFGSSFAGHPYMLKKDFILGVNQKVSLFTLSRACDTPCARIPELLPSPDSRRTPRHVPNVDKRI